MVEFTTPVGRIVWGQEPLKPKPVLDDNKQPKLDKLGQPRNQVSFGLAIPKGEFQNSVWPHLYGVAAQVYNGGNIPPAFAYKYVDGDGVDGNGVPYSQRPGYAGCYVLTISTEAIVPPLFKLNDNGQGYRQMQPNELKCGDYVAVGVDVVYNGQKSPNKPGVYVNPKAVEFIGYGEHIASQGGADPMALFGGRAHTLPAGASATPIGGSGAITMPGMGQPQPGMQPQMMPGQPQPGMQPQMMPGQPQPGMQPQMMPGQPQPGMQPQMMPGQPQPGMGGGMPAPAPEFLYGGQPQPGMQPQMMPGMMPPR